MARLTMGINRKGEPILDFRAGWDKPVRAAGVPDLTSMIAPDGGAHMRRSGVPQVIRMKISGHKTDSRERRYNIVDTDDLQVASAPWRSACGL